MHYRVGFSLSLEEWYDVSTLFPLNGLTWKLRNISENPMTYPVRKIHPKSVNDGIISMQIQILIQIHFVTSIITKLLNTSSRVTKARLFAGRENTALAFLAFIRN